MVGMNLVNQKACFHAVQLYDYQNATNRKIIIEYNQMLQLISKGLEYKGAETLLWVQKALDTLVLWAMQDSTQGLCLDVGDSKLRSIGLISYTKGLIMGNDYTNLPEISNETYFLLFCSK